MRHSILFSLTLTTLGFAAAAACSSSSSSTTPGVDGGTDSGLNEKTDSGTSPGSDSGVATDSGGVVDAGPPAVRYVGRLDNTDTAGPRCNWSGCREIAHFTGTGATATINEIPGGTAAYDVIIDGTPAATNPVIVTDATQTYPVASNLAAGDHTVELFKRSEAQDGIEQFLGFTFTGTGSALLSPPPAGTHKIEFVGDSVTAGYGIFGCDPPDGGTEGGPHTTSVRVAYSGDTATSLNADAVFVAYSGKGVTRNYNNLDTQMLSTLYLQTLVTDLSATWDFSLFKSDAIVIALGANDFNNDGVAFGGIITPTQQQFHDAYKIFVQLLRNKNPSAFIFATFTPTMFDAPPTNGLTTATAAITQVVSELNTAGDTKVSFFNNIPTAQPSDVTGCLQHPNAGYDTTVATNLVAFIKTKTGW